MVADAARELEQSRALVRSRRHAEDVRERFDEAITAGGSARELAERFGVSSRLVSRRRQILRAAGRRVLVPVGGELAEWRTGGGMARACERCGAERQLVTVGDWDVCAECEPRERAKLERPVKPVLNIEGPITPLAPTQMFLCEKYNFCSLMARACVERQTQIRKPGGTQTWMKQPVYEYCASGECRQGALIKLRVEKWNGAPAAAPTSRKEKRAEERRAAAPGEVVAIENKLLEREHSKPATAPAKEQEMSRPSKLDDVTDEKLRELHKKYGGDMKGIATDVGCSPATVSRRLVKLGLHQRKPRDSPRGAPAAKKVEKKANGHTDPAAPEGSAGAPWGRTRIALPAVGELPFEYLLACVEYARSAQQKLEKVLAA